MTNDIEFVSGPLHWNELLREGMRPEDIWAGAPEQTAARGPPPQEPFQHAVTVANLTPDQVTPSHCMHAALPERIIK